MNKTDGKQGGAPGMKPEERERVIDKMRSLMAAQTGDAAYVNAVERHQAQVRVEDHVRRLRAVVRELQEIQRGAPPACALPDLGVAVAAAEAALTSALFAEASSVASALKADRG